MKRWIFILFLLPLISCSTAPKSGVLAAKCGKTSVQETDMTAFGFKPVPGKVVVMRIFATWCPYCKTDLLKMAQEFKSGKWNADKVNIFLLAYKNHSEDKASFDTFVKKTLHGLGIPREAIQIQYLDKTYAEALPMKNANGAPLFESWKGVPFGLVFGKDGRLAFRGHFTMSDIYEEDHYKFITELQNETCQP
ncbi:MAG: hypothetical protein ACXVA9_02965 [Bdellovibrionales bacterium]